LPRGHLFGAKALWQHISGDLLLAIPALLQHRSGVVTTDGELSSGDELGRVIDAAKGLTRSEAENAFSLALVRHGKLEPETLWESKAGQLKKSGLVAIHRGTELAGAGSSGQTDSGVAARVFGSLLTWLNDHESDVFFVDLPGRDQKDAISTIHMQNYGLDAKQAGVEDCHTGASLAGDVLFGTTTKASEAEWQAIEAEEIA
jgi:hypothetical protein